MITERITIHAMSVNIHGVIVESNISVVVKTWWFCSHRYD